MSTELATALRSGGVDANVAMSSRFARFPRIVCIGLLVAVAAAIVVSGITPLPAPPKLRPGAKKDIVFYGLVIERVRHGAAYDEVAVNELRRENQPVRPFLTVRPPLLAEVLAKLPDGTARDDLMNLLSLVVIGAWTWRLKRDRQSAFWVGAVAIIMFTSVAATVTHGGWSVMHESWAGLLLALSLAVRSEKRFAASVALALVAALIRELSFPYLLVMAGAATLERRRGEALAFVLALAAALVALALHARAVAVLTNPSDLASQPWLTVSGWGLVLSEMQWNLLAMTLGGWAAAFILPLAIIGAIGRQDGLGLRLSVLLIGYSVGFAIIGRPGNINWGLMITPLTGVGLCLAPAAIEALLTRSFARASTAS